MMRTQWGNLFGGDVDFNEALRRTDELVEPTPEFVKGDVPYVDEPMTKDRWRDFGGRGQPEISNVIWSVFYLLRVTQVKGKA